MITLSETSKQRVFVNGKDIGHVKPIDGLGQHTHIANITIPNLDIGISVALADSPMAAVEAAIRSGIESARAEAKAFEELAQAAGIEVEA